MNKRLLRYSRLLHKWAGLILAIQILFWILGGVIMSAIPLEKVHGKHLANKQLENTFARADYVYSLDGLIREHSRPIKQIQFTQVLNRPFYLLQIDAPHGENMIAIDAFTGDKLQNLTAQQVNQIAQMHYLGDGNIRSTQLLENSPQEASRNQGAVWQVVYDDMWDTTLYVSPQSGQLTTVRSDIWRIFDFFWMLHIMDYDEREDFNNPLLIAFATAALVFTLSGFVLLFSSFRSWKRAFR